MYPCMFLPRILLKLVLAFIWYSFGSINLFSTAHDEWTNRYSLVLLSDHSSNFIRVRSGKWFSWKLGQSCCLLMYMNYVPECAGSTQACSWCAHPFTCSCSIYRSFDSKKLLKAGGNHWPLLCTVMESEIAYVSFHLRSDIHTCKAVHRERKGEIVIFYLPFCLLVLSNTHKTEFTTQYITQDCLLLLDEFTLFVIWLVL